MRTPEQKRVDAATKAAAEEALRLVDALGRMLTQAKAACEYAEKVVLNGKDLPYGSPWRNDATFRGMASGAHAFVVDHYPLQNTASFVESEQQRLRKLLADLDAASEEKE